jgi:predicted ATPase
VLVGRAPEQAGLKARITAARNGRGSALIITGEPGIGKSALVDDVCERAKDLRRLAVCGVESESELGFAVLADLTRDLLDHLGELVGCQNPVPLMRQPGSTRGARRRGDFVV